LEVGSAGRLTALELDRVLRWIGAASDTDDEVKTREALVNLLMQEITAVRNFQKALIPSALPTLSGLSIDAEYRVGSRQGLIGGDWYDSTRLGDGRLLFSIGDVMGHGTEAAVNMTRVRQSILTAAATTAQPTEILRRVNHVVTLQNILATAIVGIVDPETRAVELACAGHPRPIRTRPDRKVEELAMPSGAPLGVVGSLRCETLAVNIEPGDTFVFYTDGLLEFSLDAESSTRKLYAWLESDTDCVRGQAKRICDAVIGADVQPDDVAVIVLHFSALDEPFAPPTLNL
jgi:serine phosphatase RsbU (regulator of sigma subunit)